MSHPNIEVLRGSDEAMLAGDQERFLSFFTDDVVVHASGHSTLGGVYKGKEQFTELLGRFMEVVGEYTFEPHGYLADEDHGVMMQTATITRDGERLVLDEVFVCHFRDGQISEMWYLPTDQAALDDWIG